MLVGDCRASPVIANFLRSTKQSPATLSRGPRNDGPSIHRPAAIFAMLLPLSRRRRGLPGVGCSRRWCGAICSARTPRFDERDVRYANIPISEGNDASACCRRGSQTVLRDQQAVLPIGCYNWASRRVLSWRLSITMESASRHWRIKPQIFNTDQGSQFTGSAFTVRFPTTAFGLTSPLTPDRTLAGPCKLRSVS